MNGGIPMTNPFTGRTIVFTGTLAMPRKEAKALAERLGAKVADGVTQNTDFVIAGRDAGAKLLKAKSLGLVVLDETEWTEMVKQAE